MGEKKGEVGPFIEMPTYELNLEPMFCSLVWTRAHKAASHRAGLVKEMVSSVRVD